MATVPSAGAQGTHHEQSSRPTRQAEEVSRRGPLAWCVAAGVCGPGQWRLGCRRVERGGALRGVDEPGGGIPMRWWPGMVFAGLCFLVVLKPQDPPPPSTARSNRGQSRPATISSCRAPRHAVSRRPRRSRHVPPADRFVASGVSRSRLQVFGMRRIRARGRTTWGRSRSPVQERSARKRPGATLMVERGAGNGCLSMAVFQVRRSGSDDTVPPAELMSTVPRLHCRHCAPCSGPEPEPVILRPCASSTPKARSARTGTTASRRSTV